MTFEKKDIPGAYIITSFQVNDERGFFLKNFEQNIFLEHGIEFQSTESFISCSAKNVIRGMHFQLNEPQAKLVGVYRGAIYDVLVDLRRDSPTFGQWRGEYLSAENRKSFYIPRGCAHGFLSMEDETIVGYQCDGVYDKETDTGILWNDKDISIHWPIEDISMVIIGKRDQEQMSFEKFKKNCAFSYL